MIKINDKYFITADSNSYALKELLVKDENKEYANDDDNYVTLGFYTSIDSLLKGLGSKELRKYVSKKELNTIQELRDEIKKIYNFIENLNLKI